MKRQEGMLTGKSDMNSKHFFNAIMVYGEEHHGIGEPNELNEGDFRATSLLCRSHLLKTMYL